jgi:hypothetical protein
VTKACKGAVRAGLDVQRVEIDQAGKIVEADMAEAGNAGVAAREIAPSVALNLYTYSAKFWPDEDY